MSHGQFAGIELALSRLASELSYCFHDGENAVHPRVRVGKTSAVRVEREVAARRRALVGDEVRAFARSTEPEALQRSDHRVGERVVDHCQVQVVVGQPGHLERLRSGVPAPGSGQVWHLV